MTKLLEEQAGVASPTLAGRELARTMAISQAERFFNDVLDGRSADAVLAEHNAELELYLATLPPAGALLFRAFFEDEYAALQRAVVNNAELKEIVATGLARNRRVRRRQVIERVMWVLGAAACFAVGVVGYGQMSG